MTHTDAEEAERVSTAPASLLQRSEGSRAVQTGRAGLAANGSRCRRRQEREEREKSQRPHDRPEGGLRGPVCRPGPRLIGVDSGGAARRKYQKLETFNPPQWLYEPHVHRLQI